MLRLQGQVAIVTGGANGIGGATARRLAEEGASVLIADIDVDVGDANATRIREAGGVAEALLTDVTVPRDLERMVERAILRWGRLDILVNNAVAPYEQGGAEQVSEEGWDAGMTLLVKSMFLAVKHAAPELRRRGGGAIVNVASIAGQRISFGGTANYTASKAGLLGLTRHAAYELAPDGIRVNAVCPGPTATGFSGANPTEETKAVRARKIPLGRMCEPEDIADPILFLAGHAARMITGVALTVDGGVLVKNDTPYEEYFSRR